MKKIISLLLALCFACALSAAAADESYAGTWYLVRMRTGEGSDVTITGDTMSIVFEMRDDNTCDMTIAAGGESRTDSGFWVAGEGVVTVWDSSGDSRDLTVSGDELTMQSGNSIMFFSRVRSGSAELPAAVPAESAEQFSGRWRLYRVMMAGMMAEQGDIDTEQVPVLEIADGVMTETDMNEDGTFDQSVYTCTFEDGNLTAVLEDDDGSSLTIVLSLLEDGCLQGVLDDPDMEVVMFYRPEEGN